MRALVIVGWCISVGASAAPLATPVPPVKLAAQARVDFTASTNVGSINGGIIIEGLGVIARYISSSPETRPMSYMVHAPLLHFTANDFAIRFVPERSGRVQMSLRGPRDEITVGTSNRVLTLQEVVWERVHVSGATMNSNRWSELPKPVRASMIRPAGYTLNVVGGVPVVLSFRARSVIPNDLETPACVLETNSPAHQAAKDFRRGIRLNSFLESSPGKLAERRYTSSDLEAIRDQGFDHVRVPVAWHLHTGPVPDFILPESVLAETDALVTNAIRHGLKVVLSLSGFSAFSNEPTAQTDVLMSIWKQVAHRYSNAPAGVAFELISRPSNHATTEVLNDIYARLIPLIRRENPRRLLFVAPGSSADVGQLPQLRLPPEDTRIIVGVDLTDPVPFTRQGASTNTFKGIRYPGPPDEPFVPAANIPWSETESNWIHHYNTLPPRLNPCTDRTIKASATFAARWASHFGRPVHVTEIGCAVGVDETSRSRYLREVRKAIEAAGMGWTLFGWRSAYRYWDEQTPRPMPGMRSALFDPRPASPVPTNAAPQIVASNLHAQTSTASPASTTPDSPAARRPRSFKWWGIGAGLFIVSALGLVAVIRRRRSQSATATPVSPVAEIVPVPHDTGLKSGFAQRTIDRLLQHILWQHKHVTDVQRQAARELAALEQMLEESKAPMQERISAYADRIANLEKELQRKDLENAELIKAKILMTQHHMKTLRSRSAGEWKNN